MNRSLFTRKHTNIVKGLAILLMLFYHLFETEELITSTNVNYSPIPTDTFLMMSGFGNICVAIFAMLSGYGIAAGLFSQWRATENSSDNRMIPQMKAAYSQAAKRFFKLMVGFLVLYISINLIWFYRFDYPSVYGNGKQSILLILSDATGLSHIFGTPTMCATWWYMKLAYLLILLVPLMSLWASKTGYGGLLLFLVLPFTFDMGLELNRYFICAAVGVYAAYGDWFGKLLKRKGLIVIRHKKNGSAGDGKVSIFTYILNYIIFIGGFVLAVIVRSNAIVNDYFLSIVNALIALFLIGGSACVIGQIKFIRKVFEILGKYSMNMYLVHPFFYMMLWHKYIYAPKYAGLILLLLTAVCLAYSFALEMIKIGCRKLYQKIRKA